MSKQSRVPIWSQNLQTETLSTTTMGTPIALGSRSTIHIAVDGKTQMAWGYSANLTAGPTYDSYAEANSDSTTTLNLGGVVGVGQAFTGESSPGSTLVSSKFYMKKTNLPTGNAVSKIYDVTGTYGTEAIPSGTALATSGNLDVSTLTGSLVVKTFSFTGANQIELDRDKVYAVTVEYAGGDGTDNIQVGYDASSPTHGGNYSSLTGTTWSAVAGSDTVFYVLVTEHDAVLPAANIYTLDTDGFTHLTLYNPSGASSVITSVFASAN